MRHGTSQDRKDYVALIRRVQKIDRDAAQYLAWEARKLPMFQFERSLLFVFSWRYTPQEVTYWSNLEDVDAVNQRRGEK